MLPSRFSWKSIESVKSVSSFRRPIWLHSWYFNNSHATKELLPEQMCKIKETLARQTNLFLQCGIQYRIKSYANSGYQATFLPLTWSEDEVSIILERFRLLQSYHNCVSKLFGYYNCMWDYLNSKNVVHGRSKRLGWSSFGPTTFAHLENVKSYIVRRAIRENDCPPSCKFHWQKGNIVLGFSAISVYSMHIPYYNKAHAACGTCMQQNSYVESEIVSLIPKVLSSFPSFAVTESWAWDWECNPCL